MVRLRLPSEDGGEEGHHRASGEEDCSAQSRVQPGQTEVGGGQQEGGEEAAQHDLPPRTGGAQGAHPQHHQQAERDQQLEAGAEDDDDPGRQGGRQALCCRAVITIVYDLGIPLDGPDRCQLP